MSANMEKYVPIQNALRLDCKVNNIPATIRHVYSKLGKTEELVARELVIEDKVVLGIEYNKNKPVGIYTTDNKGKRVNIDIEQDNKVASVPNNIISKYIEEVSNKLSPKKEEKENNKPSAPKAKTIKTKAPIGKTNLPEM